MKDCILSETPSTSVMPSLLAKYSRNVTEVQGITALKSPGNEYYSVQLQMQDNIITTEHA